MSIIMLESWDDGLASVTTSPKWDLLTPGSSSVAASQGRRSTTGILGASAAANSLPCAFRRNLTATEEDSTLIMGFSIRPTSTPNSQTILASFESDQATTPVSHVTFVGNSNGSISAYRSIGASVGTSGTLLGTSAAGVILGIVASYLEFKVTLSDTIGVIGVRVNGISVLSLTGQDTKNAGTKTVFDRINFCPSNLFSSSTYYDDFYLLNSLGASPNNDYWGDTNIEFLLPNANGAFSQMLGNDGDRINNFSLVNETVPSITGYVGSAVDGEKDTYAMGDLSSLNGVVRGVQVELGVLKADTGARTARAVLRSGASEATGADKQLLTTLGAVLQVFEVNPATSAAFTAAAVNAMEIGIEVRP